MSNTKPSRPALSAWCSDCGTAINWLDPHADCSEADTPAQLRYVGSAGDYRVYLGDAHIGSVRRETVKISRRTHLSRWVARDADETVVARDETRALAAEALR